MKRFTDTSKWSDPWFRRLSAPAKMLWFYILDHCDHVGMIELDIELAARDCGIKMTAATLAEIGDRIEPAGNGKLIVPKFIKFQVGEPSVACKAHTKIIQAIAELDLFKDSAGYHYPTHRLLIDYPMTNNSHKEEDKDKDKDKEEDKEEEEEKQNPEFHIPETITEPMKSALIRWRSYRKEIRKPITPTGWAELIANCLKQPDTMVHAINKSILSGWQGLFPDPSKSTESEPAKPKPKKLPANWREIGQLRYGRDFTDVEIDQLTYDEFGDIQRDCRFYADNPDQLAADMAQAEQLSPL